MRAFIAIKIPESIRDKISELQESLGRGATHRAPTQGIRWVAPKNIHLTLKFLGEVKEKQIEAISSAIKSSIQGIAPFNISLSTVGAFPNLRRPRVLWIGVKEGKEQLIKLMIQLNKKLSRLGFETETRAPSPHLTIGRVKKVQSSEFRVQSFETPPFLANRVYLVKSELTPDGPIYTDIKEFKL